MNIKIGFDPGIRAVGCDKTHFADLLQSKACGKNSTTHFYDFFMYIWLVINDHSYCTCIF